MVKHRWTLIMISLNASIRIITAFLATSFAMMAVSPQNPHTAEALMGEGLHLEEVDLKLPEAIAAFKKVLAAPDRTRMLTAAARLHIGLCYERMGMAEARTSYQQLIKDYPDLSEIVRQASTHLEAMNAIGMPKPPAATMRQIPFDLKRASPGPPAPNGLYLAYYYNSADEIGVLDLATGGNRIVTKNKIDVHTVSVTDAVWSWDSERIAYSMMRVPATTFYSEKYISELHVVDLSSRASETLFTIENQMVGLGSWLPDGKSFLSILPDQKGVYGFARIGVDQKSIDFLRPLSPNNTEIVFGTCMVSPDGRLAAYDFANADDHTNFNISVFPISGGPEIPVVEYKSDDRLIGWNPDGRGLLFSSNRRGSIDLWQIDISESGTPGEAELVSLDLGAIKPLGVTGKGTFYFSRQPKTQDIYIAELDVQAGRVISQPSRVDPTHSYGNSRSGSWSPDGRHLAYMCDVSTAQQQTDKVCLFSLDDGRNKKLILNVPINPLPIPQWASDGSELILRGWKDDKLISWQIAVETGKVLGEYESKSSTNPRFFSRKDKATGSVSLFYREPTGETSELYRSQKSARISPNSRSSPDGKRFCLILLPDDKTQEQSAVIIVIDVDGRTATELRRFENSALLRWAGWSRDSKDILYLTSPGPDVPQTRELWKISADGGAARKFDISFPAGSVESLELHPDGAHVAFTCYYTIPTQVWSMDNILGRSGNTVAKKQNNRQRED